MIPRAAAKRKSKRQAGIGHACRIGDAMNWRDTGRCPMPSGRTRSSRPGPRPVASGTGSVGRRPGSAFRPRPRHAQSRIELWHELQSERAGEHESVEPARPERRRLYALSELCGGAASLARAHHQPDVQEWDLCEDGNDQRSRQRLCAKDFDSNDPNAYTRTIETFFV